MSGGHHPLYCIVPPYILKEIVSNGTPPQRDWAVKTIRVTTQMHDDRDQVAQSLKPFTVKEALASAGGKNRFIYDVKYGSNLPGVPIRKEGDGPVLDPAVNEAYDGAGNTYDFYYQVYNRDSIDNQGLRLDSSVHYMKGFDNAFWNGEQMVYGDGDEDLPMDQRIFNRFTSALDVIGHELTHGVVQCESNLVYSGQPGALNESFADVFGSMVKQYTRNQTVTQADWIIGEGIFTHNVNALGVRSMKAPGTAYDDPLIGKDPQSATMSGYINTQDDNGGVHINCGIPNHAFYLAAVEIGGYSWEKIGKIWYTALCKRLSSGANFQEAADVTHKIAGELYGLNSLEQAAVYNGWAGVGITPNNTSGGGGSSGNGGSGGSGGGSSPGCLTSLLGIFRPRS